MIGRSWDETVNTENIQKFKELYNSAERSKGGVQQAQNFLPIQYI